MKRAMFTAEQILGLLKEQQAGDMTVDGTWKYVGLESGTLDVYRFRWGSGLDRAMHHDRSMRRPRRESTARMCDNAIGARDQRTTSGPTGVMTRIKQAEDMTASAIKRNTAK